MFNHIKYVLGVLLSLSLVSNAFALGASNIGNEAFSARAAGMGFTGIAGATDDPTAVYTNPAAIGHTPGTQLTAGLVWENLHGSYKDSSGMTTDARLRDAAVPSIAVTHSFLDGQLGAGLSVESPFGLETHWAGDSALRYVATNSVLHMVDISPAVSYRVCPIFSVGAGVDYVNVFDAMLEKHINVDALNNGILAANGFPQTSSGSADANSRLQGSAANWGYHFGFQLQPNEHHSIGVTYHSKVKLNINGTVEIDGLSGISASPLVFGGSSFKTSVYTDVSLPQSVQLGYAYKPTDQWLYEVDAAWYDWYANRDLNVRYPAAPAALLPILNTGNPQPFNSKDEWSLSAGVNYKQNDHLQWRTGAWYLPNATPESTFTPSIMDLTRYGLTVGTGIGLTPALTLDLAYNAIFFHNRDVNNGITNSGTYGNFANLVAIDLVYRFK